MAGDGQRWTEHRAQSSTQGRVHCRIVSVGVLAKRTFLTKTPPSSSAASTPALVTTSRRTSCSAPAVRSSERTRPCASGVPSHAPLPTPASTMIMRRTAQTMVSPPLPRCLTCRSPALFHSLPHPPPSSLPPPPSVRASASQLRRPLLASPSISPFAPLPLHPRRSFASTPIQASNSLTVRQTNAVATRPPSFPPETAERIIEIMTPQKPDVEPKQLKRHATRSPPSHLLPTPPTHPPHPPPLSPSPSLPPSPTSPPPPPSVAVGTPSRCWASPWWC